MRRTAALMNSIALQALFLPGVRRGPMAARRAEDVDPDHMRMLAWIGCGEIGLGNARSFIEHADSNEEERFVNESDCRRSARAPPLTKSRAAGGFIPSWIPRSSADPAIPAEGSATGGRSFVGESSGAAKRLMITCSDVGIFIDRPAGIQPGVHCGMGGVAIDCRARVVSARNGRLIPGLLASGRE